MHLQLGMDPVEDGDDWMEEQWEKWLTHEFSLDEFEDEDLSEVTEITDQYQEEDDVTSWPANSVAVREEGPWARDGAGLSLELIDAEEGGEEEEEEEEEAQDEEAKRLVRAKERLSRLDATTGRGEEKQQQEEVVEDAGSKATLSFGGGRPSCVVMDTHRPKRPTTLALFPHQLPPPRSQDTINNNSLGKKDSWKDSQPSSPHTTGDPPPAQEDRVQPGKRRSAPKPPRANSSTDGKTTSASLHTGPDAHAPPHGTLPPGTAPGQHADAPRGQQRGGWGRGRGKGGGVGRGVVVATTRGDTGEGVKAERRGGRLCEGRDRSATQNPRERGPGQRPPRVEDIKEAGGTRGGARGRGRGKMNSFHDQTICLTAMVVPRTPVAPRKQDKSQVRPDKTLGKQDKSQIKQDKAQGKLDNKTQDKTWLKQDNAQVKLDKMQDKSQLKQDKTHLKTQVKQDKTQNKTHFKQDRLQVKQDNTQDRIQVKQDNIQDRIQVKQDNIQDRIQVKRDNRQDRLQVKQDNTQDRIQVKRDNRQDRIQAKQDNTQDRKQVKQDNRQDKTQQWSQESDRNNDIAQDCPANLSRSSSEASSNRMSLSSDTEGPPPGPLHPTHPDRTNPDISEEDGEGEPTPSNCLNGVGGHLDNHRETDRAKSRARGVDSGHGGVHQHGGVSVSSDNVRGHPVANHTAPNSEAVAGLTYDSIKYTLVVDEHAQLELVRLKDCHHGYRGRDEDSDTETVYQSANEDEDPDYEQERKRKGKDEEKNIQERSKDERKREEERRRREEYVTICRQPKGMSTTTSEEEVSKGGRVGFPRSRKFLNVIVNGGSNYNVTGAESFGMFSCVLDGMERQQSHRAVYRFVPRHADELHLETDDPVLILAQSEDLWCQGYNMRTGATGIFPAYYAVRVPKESSKGHTDGWIERFSVRFLGSVQVPFHKGNDVLCAAMQKVASNRRAMQPPSACVLEVSVRGLKISVQDQCHSADRGEQCFHFFHLKNISFCGCHPKHSKYFGFITKHPDQQRFACHVMMSEMTSLPLAESVGRAFQQYYKEHIGYSCPTEDIFIE